jgi:hypothetical protein
MALAITSNPDPTVREECQMADLDTTMGEGTRSLDMKAAIILPDVVVSMWKVHQL